MTSRTGGSLALAWQEPVDFGGVPLTGYELAISMVTAATQSTPDVYRVVGLSTVLYGLQGGAHYLVQVLAKNSVFDQGQQSDALHAYTLPFSQPTAPRSAVQVGATGGSVSLRVVPPLDLGGYPLMQYGMLATRASSGSSWWYVARSPAQGQSTVVKVQGSMDAGTTYDVRVFALNSRGPAFVANATVRPGLTLLTLVTPPSRTIVFGEAVEIRGVPYPVSLV